MYQQTFPEARFQAPSVSSLKSLRGQTASGKVVVNRFDNHQPPR